jgi:hypothetical protein
MTRAETAVACPQCDADATREPDWHKHRCSACGWRGDACPTCGAVMAWDPARTGTTCGGLEIAGALVCCGNVMVSYLSKPADAIRWSLAKGGRSLNAGGIRVRAEGRAGDDVGALMARLLRLPELEIEVERLRAELAQMGSAP